jgi:hypothetical protein
MESLSCRSPPACAACSWSARGGACTLEAQLDAALEPAPRAPLRLALRAEASA